MGNTIESRAHSPKGMAQGLYPRWSQQRWPTLTNARVFFFSWDCSASQADLEASVL